MTTRAPDLSTEAAIRQAVAFGRQAAVREIMDLLHLARREANWAHSHPSSLTSQAQILAYHRGQTNGLDEALKVVRGYRIDPREDPS